MMTDFLAWDRAVGHALEFAIADGETLLLAMPDHNTGGPKIGNYGKPYTNQPIEDLLGVFNRATMTINGVIAMMPEDPTPQDIVDAFQTYWDLNITMEHAEEVFTYQEETGQRFGSALGRIISDHYTYIGWTTHGHNGETGK